MQIHVQIKQLVQLILLSASLKEEEERTFKLFMKYIQ